jgi:hypothetical protein
MYVDSLRLKNIFSGKNAILIQGADGEEYVVTSDGQVMGVDEFQATGGNSRLMDNYKEEKEAQAQPTVTFSASPNQKYGFDAYTEIKTNIQNEYPELKPGYRPAFKSVASYAADKVQTNGETFVHEAGHTFSLKHPFETMQYRQGSTTNFMDYSLKKDMFWQWQWEIINSSDFKK